MKLIALTLLVLVPAAAFCQIEPQFPYNGVDRPIPVTISRPTGAKGDLTVRLLKTDGKTVVDKQPIKAGRNDLAAILPMLWKKKLPEVLHAQLFAGEKPVGPALVLQPMTNPAVSRLKADGKTLEFVPDDDHAYAGVRAWVDKDIVLETSMGTMRFRMRPDCAPNTVWNIMQLVAGGFYREVIWHRVVKESHGFPFVIQGGDPTGTGEGGPGFAYPLEDSSLPHDFGIISIARSTDPNTNGCQVFVCLSREGTARLDHKYASFGECIEGGDVILRIAEVPTGKEDRPLNPPIIHAAKLVDSAPFGTGPQKVRR